jgi:hypothetical protein
MPSEATQSVRERHEARRKRDELRRRLKEAEADTQTLLLDVQRALDEADRTCLASEKKQGDLAQDLLEEQRHRAAADKRAKAAEDAFAILREEFHSRPSRGGRGASAPHARGSQKPASTIPPLVDARLPTESAWSLLQSGLPINLQNPKKAQADRPELPTTQSPETAPVPASQQQTDASLAPSALKAILPPSGATAPEVPSVTPRTAAPIPALKTAAQVVANRERSSGTKVADAPSNEDDEEESPLMVKLRQFRLENSPNVP